MRKRYARQIARYGLPMRRWLRTLHRAADGERDDADLRALLRAAQEGTRFYPEAFAAAGVQWRDLQAPEDLAAFPLLSRRVLQERYYEIFHRDVDADAIDEGWLGRSSGSTGEPVRFFMDAVSIHFFTTFIRFLWERLRLGPLPRPGCTGIVLLCTLPRSSVYGTWMPLFRATRFRKLHFAEPDAERTLSRLAPSVVTGDPDSLARFADALEEGATTARPRLILSSAFALPAGTAARLESATGAAVIDYYSMAETGPIGWRCPADRARFHVVSGAVEVESAGGELLVTNLRNHLFPLIRYRTGDLARVEEDPAPCACGVHGRRIAAFAGRTSERFVARDGRRVDPSRLQPLISALAVRQFRLEQRAPDAIVLRWWGEEMPDERALRSLERGAASLLGGPVGLESVRCVDPLFRPGEKPIVYATCLTG